MAPSCSRWGSWRAEPAPLPQEEVGLALDRGLWPSSALRPAECSPWPALARPWLPRPPADPCPGHGQPLMGASHRERALPPHLK